MKQQSGFTLIELLLVLAIIGIISSIAIPALMGQKEKANRRATEGTYNAVITECQNAAKAKSSPTASAVMTYVANLKNFKWPNCKNPYTNTSASPALLNGTAATTSGQVGMVTGTMLDPNGSSMPCITINYVHKGGSGSTDVGIE